MKFETATLLAWMIALNGLTVLLLISSGFVRVKRRRPTEHPLAAEATGYPELATEKPAVPDEPVDSGQTRRRAEERLASNLSNWGGGEASGEVLPLAAELCRGNRRGTVTEHLV